MIVQVWVISPDWANVQVNGNGFTLNGNSRMYFASRPTDGFDADAYWQVRPFALFYFLDKKQNSISLDSSDEQRIFL